MSDTADPAATDAGGSDSQTAAERLKRAVSLLEDAAKSQRQTGATDGAGEGQQIAQLQATCNELRQDNDALSAERDRLQDALSSARDQNSELEAVSRTISTRLDSTIDRLRKVLEY